MLLRRLCTPFVLAVSLLSAGPALPAKKPAAEAALPASADDLEALTHSTAADPPKPVKTKGHQFERHLKRLAQILSSGA